MSNETKTKKPVWITILKVLLAIVLVLVLLFAALVAYLSITEFKPDDREAVALTGKATASLSEGDSFTLMSWNIGYGALGDNADFFMEGGEMVNTADEARVEQNMKGICDEVNAVSPDVLFLQEVDADSTRSHHVDETAIIDDLYSNDTTCEALYYSVNFVPYPLPPIGEVHTSLQTLSHFPVSDATRIQLPVPFKWPTRMANLKRALLVTRVPLENSDKELVLVNLHLEAYDDGAGKEAQTNMLLDVMQKEYAKGNYVVAAGDFNQCFSNVDDSMYPVAEGLWEVGLVDADKFAPNFTLVMDNLVPTCRSLYKPLEGADPDTFQYYLIDGFIVSKNLKIDSVTTEDCGFLCADHNPVVLTATLQ